MHTEINFCLKVGTGIWFSKFSSYSHVKIYQRAVKYSKPWNSLMALRKQMNTRGVCWNGRIHRYHETGLDYWKL